MDQDLYAQLGVTPDADAEQISRAYRRLVRTLHPDAAAGRPEVGPERLTQAVAAYRVLHDPAERAAYDRDHAHDRSRPDRAESNDSAESQVPLIAGPTVVHSRSAPSSRSPGPVIRVGPPIRLG